MLLVRYTVHILLVSKLCWPLDNLRHCQRCRSVIVTFVMKWFVCAVKPACQFLLPLVSMPPPPYATIWWMIHDGNCQSFERHCSHKVNDYEWKFGLMTPPPPRMLSKWICCLFMHVSTIVVSKGGRHISSHTVEKARWVVPAAIWWWPQCVQ